MMKGIDILDAETAKEYLGIDYDETLLNDFIQGAFDIISDSVDNFEQKLVSAKFKRKLKLCMLSTVANIHDVRDLTTDKEDKLRFISQVMLLQLKYGEYTETDV